MRITVQTKPELEEALEFYLDRETERVQRQQELQTLAGSLSEAETAELRRATQQLRESWG